MDNISLLKTGQKDSHVEQSGQYAKGNMQKVCHHESHNESPGVGHQLRRVPVFTFDSPDVTVSDNSTLYCDTPGLFNFGENACLPHPAMDARSRLTSTPNVTVSSFDRTEDGLEFSPPCQYYPNGHMGKVQRTDKDDCFDDIRSVLFPPNKPSVLVETPMNNDGSNSAGDDFEKTARPCDLFRSSTQKHANHWASFHDSGIDSLASSAISHQDSLLSVTNSPLKRRAHDGASLESPMKRLAFMALGNSKNTSAMFNLEERFTGFDTTQPGSSFLDCRNEVNEDSLESPPTPIFANSVQYLPPERSNSAAISKHCSLHENFKFTKPLGVPQKQKNESPCKSLKLGYSIKPKFACYAGETYCDIITQLANRNLYHVITKIFSDIRPKDIFRCSHVSRSWAEICKNNRPLRDRIKILKNQYQKDAAAFGTENFTVTDALMMALLKSPAKEERHRNLSRGRLVLGNIQTKAKRTPTKTSIVMPKTPSGKNHFVPAFDKFEHNQGVKRTLEFGETLRPCPVCGWTAKIYGGDSNKGLCYRYNCQHKFCSFCKSSYHPPAQCPVKQSPPSLKETIKAPKIGTKKSRDRLKKRLLM